LLPLGYTGILIDVYQVCTFIPAIGRSCVSLASVLSIEGAPATTTTRQTECVNNDLFVLVHPAAINEGEFRGVLLSPASSGKFPPPHD
jgi:hypothetical protein